MKFMKILKRFLDWYADNINPFDDLIGLDMSNPYMGDENVNRRVQRR